MEKITAICQARMSSSRLPGKVLKKLGDKTVIAHLVERLKKSEYIDEIIIATSNDESDDDIQIECEKLDINCFRGSLNDVLERFYFAAKKYNAKNIMRICCDSPLLDYDMIDDISKVYFEKKCDIIRNDKVPVGFAVEIFSFEKLEEAYNNAKEPYQREHVTPYIYENCNWYLHENHPDYSNYRFTLDTEEDFILLKEIFKELYKGEHDFHMQDVIDLVNRRRELFEINCNVVQKTSSLDYIKK